MTKKCCSPLVVVRGQPLSPVVFDYVGDQWERPSLTRTRMEAYRPGTELVVAGRIDPDHHSGSYVAVNVEAGPGYHRHVSIYNKKVFVRINNRGGESFIERLWAFITVSERMETVEEVGQRLEVVAAARARLELMAGKYGFLPYPPAAATLWEHQLLA